MPEVLEQSLQDIKKELIAKEETRRQALQEAMLMQKVSEVANQENQTKKQSAAQKRLKIAALAVGGSFVAATLGLPLLKIINVV